jgi:hypothetical protein
MALTLMGESPFATDSEGRLKCRIATIFLPTATLVTLPGVHFTQRVAYTKALDAARRAEGGLPLSEDQKRRVWESAVDLIVDGRNIQIRPDPSNMALAFAADDLLQELVPKQHIQFLYARDPMVQQAIRERGEYWRISPVPQSPDEVRRIIAASRIGIGGRRMYYYNALKGTRYLTQQEFAGLAALDDEELRRHLIEVRDFSRRCNRGGQREVAFYGAGTGFGSDALAGYDFERADGARLRVWHRELCGQFRAAVPAALHEDAPADLGWSSRLAAGLLEGPDEVVTDEALLPAISPEFFRQIRWLPGGRIENGELVFDSVFSQWEASPHDRELRELCDQRVKGFVCNYIREFGALQYVNIGLISNAVRRRRAKGGHQAYIAEVLHRGELKPLVRIIRIQRWGIRQHLDEGEDLLRAVMEAEEYTEYTLDRRLGCWELGMPLPARIDTRRVWETYYGDAQRYHGTRIWTTCFERDFIPGLATDKIPPERFLDPRFALDFARLLGQAAAPNLVVGRTTDEGKMIFDDGDEVLILDADGHPQRLVVADHAGTFNEYDRPLGTYAEAYAQPAVSRLRLVADPEAFAEAYVAALCQRLAAMQVEYRRQRRAFDTLFVHSKQGQGTFSWRWARALARLERTDVEALAQRLRDAIGPFQRCEKKCQPPAPAASPGSPGNSSR